MFTTTVKAFDRFPQITAKVERAARVALDAAAREGFEVAVAGASIDLEFELIPAHGDVDGYSAGIKSRKQTSTPGKTTPIARFFDEGTLGQRTKPLKRARKSSWTEQKKATGTVYTATRGDVSGKGIPAEHFLPAARRAGRRKLIASLDSQLP